MLQGVLDLGRGGTFQSRTERRHRGAHQPGPPGAARHRRPGALLRTHRPPARAGVEPTRRTAAGRVLPHRPAGRLGPGPRAAGGRLARPGGGALLPGHRPRPQGLARRRHLAVRGRTVLGLEDEYFVDPEGRPARRSGRSRRGADRTAGERLLADGLVLGGPGALLSALGQARTGQMGDIIGTIQREQDEIIRSPLPGCSWSRAAGHRQDGGGAAPGRLPPLHAPLPAGAPGRPRRRPEPVVPALHRAGPALPRRDRGQPVDGGRAGARGPRARRRRPGRGPAEGRRAHGQGPGQGRADPAAPAPPRRRGPLRRRRAAPAGPDDRGHRGHGPAPARDPQRPPALRRVTGPARALGRVPRQARAERRRRGGRATRPTRRGAERPGPAAAPGARGHRRPRPDVAPPVAPRVPHDLLGARALLTAAGKGFSRAGGAAAVPAAQHIARRRCSGRWATPP